MNSSTNQIHKWSPNKINIFCLHKRNMINNSNINTWKIWIISCQFPLRYKNIFKRLRLNTGNVCISEEMGAEKMSQNKIFQPCNISWITGIWNSSFSKEQWLKFLTAVGKHKGAELQQIRGLICSCMNWHDTTEISGAFLIQTSWSHLNSKK